jgi:hypothetical protein
MAGYTRQSATDIVDGANILAVHFNDEFDQLEAAFNAISGHTHDGSAGNGGPIAGLGVAGTNEFISVDSQNFGPASSSAFMNIRNFRDIQAIEKVGVGINDSFARITSTVASFNVPILANANAGNIFTQLQINNNNNNIMFANSNTAISVTNGDFDYNVTSRDFMVDARNIKLHAASNNSEIIKNIQIGNSSSQKDGYFENVHVKGSSSKLYFDSGGKIEFNSVNLDQSATNVLRIQDPQGQSEFLFSVSQSGKYLETPGSLVFGSSSSNDRFIKWSDQSNPGMLTYEENNNRFEFYFDGSNTVAFVIEKDFSNQVKLYFGNPQSSAPYLRYDTNNQRFKFNLNNTDQWSLDNSGNLRIRGYLYENQFNV